MMQDEFASTD